MKKEKIYDNELLNDIKKYNNTYKSILYIFVCF